MDPRANFKGLEELKATRAAFARLAGVAENLPAAFKQHEYMLPEKRGKLLIALCEAGFEQHVGKLKDAYTAVLELPQQVTLSYSWPNEDGQPSGGEYQIQTPSWYLREAFEGLDRVLGTLCEDIKAFQTACSLASQLEDVVKRCPPDHYGSRPYIAVDMLARAFEDYLEKTQRELASAVTDIANSAQGGAQVDGVLEQDGLVANLDEAWAKVPQLSEDTDTGQPTFEIGDSSQRKTTVLVAKDGSATPHKIPDQQANFLKELAIAGVATVDRTVKSRLIDNIPGLDGIIHSADWPEGLEKPHNKACYRLDDSAKGRIKLKTTPTQRR